MPLTYHTADGRIPAVSVCVPAYQSGRHIGATIASVLAQNFTDFELVILDNASTDDTAELVKSYEDSRIRLLRNDRTVPMTENWNRAVAACRAPLVKLLCADDLLRPDCLRVQHQVMHARPGLAMTACRRDFVTEDGVRLATGRGLAGLLGTREAVAVARRVVRHGGNPIGEPGSVLFRRAAFDSSGGFAASMNLVLDVHLWLRLVRHGSFFGTADSLAVFRVGGGTLSGKSHRAGARQQAACAAELTANPTYRIRTLDKMVGTISAPMASLRRRALFAVADV